MEFMLKERLRQSFTNIIEDLEKHENQRSQSLKAKEKAPKSQTTILIWKEGEKSSTCSKFTKNAELGAQEILQADKSQSRLSEKDVEILKSKINIEYQRYNEFALEAKNLGLDLDVLQAGKDLQFIGSSKQASRESTASYGSPTTLAYQNMSQSMSPYFTAVPDSKETSTGKNTGAHTPAEISPHQEFRILPQGDNMIEI
jgi:hypothetical protein